MGVDISGLRVSDAGKFDLTEHHAERRFQVKVALETCAREQGLESVSQIENIGNVQSVFVMGIIKDTVQLVY